MGKTPGGKMKTLKIGQVGSGFISEVHNKAFSYVKEAEISAICDVDKVRAKAYSKKFNIPEVYESLDEMLAKSDIDVVTLGVPNYLHCELALAAAAAGKHVIVEKPLALTLDEADKMIAACKKAGVVLGYAEELVYAPKFEHAKKIADSGAIGDVFYVKQAEKHGGPYSPWFWKSETAGGGILMDMGCHAIEYCRWALDKPPVKSVYCQADTFVHNPVTKLEDHIIMIIEFEGGKLAMVESSWTLKGDMISVAEVHGREGVIHANLLQEGMGLKVFSEKGWGEESWDREETRGWTHPDWAWNWQNGYPQEMQDFINCALNGGTPMESGEDGKAVLEIMIAGYMSAAQGRKIEFPFEDPGDYNTPVEIWMRSRGLSDKD
jgi:predicted dehydrogenase